MIVAITGIFKKASVLIFILLIAIRGQGFQHFITVDKDKLKDGDKDFRFVSFNIPNLHYNEDYMKFDETNPWRLPDEYEIRDGLRAIKQIGGKVTRIYTLSVRKPGESEKIIRHVLGPGKFNEEAFKALDLVLKVADEEGVRIIFPILDNWWWWGGPKEYAAFRNKVASEFWTDTLLISDFKKTINFLLNRKNTYTGVLYKDDKAVLGWETGNELECPYLWIKQIAAYIKSIDKNHLVIQNSHVKIVDEDEITDPNIDVVSTHYYTNAETAIEAIKRNRENTRGIKPYYVGEFGFQPTNDMAAVIDSVISDSVSGIMLWSMRTHNRDGGFYYHASDKACYRWPGFSSGNYFDEKNVEEMVRQRAYKIDGQTPPPLPVPDKPTMLPIETPFKISWQGSTGASFYTIERKTEGDSDWKIIADSVSDAVWGYKPQFSDTTVQIGKSYSYRIKAKNISGESDWSEAVGPVAVKYKILIDEFENDRKIFKKEGSFEFLTRQQLVQAKEDKNRLNGNEGDYIIYKIPGTVESFNVNFFMTGGDGSTELSGSSDGENFIPLKATKQIFVPEQNEYKFFIGASYICNEIQSDYKYFKLVFGDGVQLCKVEASYIDNK